MAKKAEKRALIDRTLQIIEEIYKLIGPAVPEEWLSSDLTVTQLRFLLVLQACGPRRMSDIAAGLKVTLPTATILADNLVRKNLVQRQASPADRRLVICRLSPEGQNLINKLWGSGRLTFEKLLTDLTGEEVQKAADLADILYRQALKISAQK